MPNFPSWAECAPDLIDTAAGRRPADLVITKARLANVHSREILEGWGIAVTRGRFAYVGPAPEGYIGTDTMHIDAEGQLLIPGLCDGHMHIESGMLTPAEFASAVIPHGTTTMFTDPHEIANVMGLDGVRLMHDEALAQPVNIFTQMPSCAPSAPGLETTGHEITPEDVKTAMTWPGIIGLGEMMNFPGVAAGDAKMLAEMAATEAAGKVIGGHYASPDLGAPFHAYVAGGPADDHEGVAEADAIARLRQGMRAMLRLGSAWYDVEAQITAVTQRGLDPRGVILCTDDCHSGTLVRDGHMNRVLRHAIACGCDPMIALQMCTINTATHFGLERELGSIAPGRRADMILTTGFEDLPIERVFARGQEVARGGHLLVNCPHIAWPDYARSSVRLGRDLAASDFEIHAEPGQNTARVRVIGVVENQAPTRALEADLTVRNGLIEASGEVCHIALVERHRGTGGVTNGFVQGFGYTGSMAIASTVAHDSHHMIVVGTDRASMAIAANRLAEVGGGITLIRDGREVALVELPIAGLMSDRPAREVAQKADRLGAEMRASGCSLNNAIMQHSLLALVVIPELRISDLGLVDVTQFSLTDVVIKDNA
ncbi:MAG: adenine deaminase [Pseudomonadota bacterium]